MKCTHEFVVWKPCGCWGLLMAVDMNDPHYVREYAKALSDADRRGLSHELLTEAEWTARGKDVIAKTECDKCRPQTTLGGL